MRRVRSRRSGQRDQLVDRLQSAVFARRHYRDRAGTVISDNQETPSTIERRINRVVTLASHLVQQRQPAARTIDSKALIKFRPPCTVYNTE